MFDMFDSNSRGWFMRLMDDEVEGTVEEVEVEFVLVSAIVGPWDRKSSDTMKSFYSDRKKKRERDFGNEKKIFLMKRKLYYLILSFQWCLQYI